jgi:hypothetical protein
MTAEELDERWVETVVVRLDRDDSNLLALLSDTERIPKTELVRRALRTYATLHSDLASQPSAAAS